MDNTQYALTMASKLSIATYTSNGSSDSRIAYINKLLKDYDFVFVQEHWLQSCQFEKYTKKFTNACAHSVSGMKSNELISGRPKGGCSIIWKRNLLACVTPVITDCNRICAVCFSYNNIKYLMCNVYMPCYDNNEYVEILGVLISLCQSPDYDSIIIGGDFNMSFERPDDPLITVLNDFTTSQNLICGLSCNSSDISYTCESKVYGTRSINDHFFVSENIFNSINKYCSVHDGDNCSDHSPVVLSLSLSVEYSNDSTGNCSPSISVDWEKITDEHINNYKLMLDELLCDMDIDVDCIHCNDYKCNDQMHYQQIQEIHDFIVDSCTYAGYSCFPLHKCKSNNVNVVPGWSSHVEQCKNDAIFWHKLWKENGSPRSGFLYNNRNSTRSK